MNAIRYSKIVRIGADPFTIFGERRPDGRLRFTVDDTNCVLHNLDDGPIERFRDDLKQRLREARRLREQA
jgi:hypothetical protein